ncbi:hypothetical protein RHOER0001_0028 [Rhodococcus erythropolis SK121]|nr:hypothetical protein RHOER0001_0028 [Rhodococcus erythropolis SK121]
MPSREVPTFHHVRALAATRSVETLRSTSVVVRSDKLIEQIWSNNRRTPVENQPVK